MRTSIHVSCALLGGLLANACSARQPAQQAQERATSTGVPAAAPNEVTYRATGTEPFWGMTVTPRELRITWPEPEPSVATPYTVEENASGRSYKSKTLTATVTYKTCSDGMSERAYPHTVKLELADRVLQGCGWPAGYDLGPPP